MRHKLTYWLRERIAAVCCWTLRRLADDSNLLSYADRELRAAGFHLDRDDGGSIYDGMLHAAALDLVALFSLQEHSGMSASVVRGVVGKLFAFEPLGPLTGEDEEWNLVGAAPGPEGGRTYQNRRASNVFRDGDGQAYQSDYRVFREPDGITYTSRDSREPIKSFPYTPKHVTVDVPAA